MCGQHYVRTSAEDNTRQNTKDTHPIPGQKLKFLTPPRRVERQGLLLGETVDSADLLISYIVITVF